MEIPGASAWQLYVSLSRKRPTHTHMNTQTLSLSRELTFARPTHCLSWTSLMGGNVQKSSQMRQKQDILLWKTKSADRKCAIQLHLCCWVLWDVVARKKHLAKMKWQNLQWGEIWFTFTQKGKIAKIYILVIYFWLYTINNNVYVIFLPLLPFTIKMINATSKI